jgi:hypothetical protein
MTAILCLPRRLLAALAFLVLAAALVPSARATSASTDASDLWWIPAESGWGIQLNQQHATIFATMFVYAQGGQPEFYVAALEPTSTGYVWTGTVYRTTGPWWGASFNSALVNEVPVGAMSFQMLTVSTARLDYTIAGVRVIKDVQRMSFANDRFGGTFLGALKRTAVSGPCASTTPVEAGVQVTHNGGSTLSATLATTTFVCSTSGAAYTQRGQFGSAYGNYGCTNGETGTISMFEMKGAVDTLTFRFRFTGSGPGYSCTMDGDFAGVQQ